MNERKLCINAGLTHDVPLQERLRLIRRAGFDGVFTSWEPGCLAEVFPMIRREGLYFQSVHAPFGEVHLLWEAGEPGEAYLKMLMDCVEECAGYRIPMAVIHAIIGFDRHDPSDVGIERFDRLCRLADSRGVLLGFENTEGEEYLARIFAELRQHPSCGFCWDTGHERCYNHSRDLVALYGDLLVGTHLNDNLGITGDETTWLDDAHLLPFDGTADWQGIADRLSKIHYAGPLTFELTSVSKPGRTTHDRYSILSPAEFIQLAYEKAAHFAAML